MTTTEWTIRRFSPPTKNGTAQWHIVDNSGGVVAGPVANLTELFNQFGDEVITAFGDIAKEVTEA